ncbi:sugar ABC transporter substrate-binding protein [Dictyobacter alpinus]|uniref:Sugar ABC transporter substrate-binding protein n=1 Tax=Dictyobacter alpinus TaxID=2014873 RepID=A0A402AZL8_9CHLR|nr:substrate-binding domain-containing protein [Dictyobacter alpinus]GCE24550.1 sugar ABC transporter substrate-binding protein [Dictyobacter alpinus]
MKENSGIKKFGRRRSFRYELMGTLLFSCMLLASCSFGDNSGVGNIPSGNGGKNCTHVGVFLPDRTTSDRWEHNDHPLLEETIKKAIPGVSIDYHNANGDSDAQLTQTTTGMVNGDCILVVAAHDSIAAEPIVAQAKAHNIPVIAYDRLIQSKDLDYYVSFNNTKVGSLQAKYIVDHYQTYKTADKPVRMALISGSQTDTNALLFSIGAHSVLDPLLATNELKIVNEVFTPDWSNTTAQTEMEAVLADNQNDIQIAYVANDGMAGSVITALENAKLTGKVLVTGQDATLGGLRNILQGKQSMTVYKPIAKEAQSVGDLVKALYDGNDVKKLTGENTTSTYNGGLIPSILDDPISVDIQNIKQTVIKDGYVSMSDLCKGLLRGSGNVC